VLIQHSQSEVHFGISVPASYTEQTIRVGLWMGADGDVDYGVTVRPRDADRFLAERDPHLLKQLRTLAASGFEQAGTRGEWYSSHPGKELLEASDAPSALLKAVTADITAVAESRILSYDLKQPVPRAFRRSKLPAWG
jgi:hypothetical protein